MVCLLVIIKPFADNAVIPTLKSVANTSTIVHRLVFLIRRTRSVKYLLVERDHMIADHEQIQQNPICKNYKDDPISHHGIEKAFCDKANYGY